MKKLILIIVAALSINYAKAQAQLDFPFQGGSVVMSDFFKANVLPGAGITRRAAAGMVMMKFTADAKGNITKMVVYYADDASLTEPVIGALKKTNGKWIIPEGQKNYDFIIPFSIGPDAPSDKFAKNAFQFYKSKTPITANDQIPLNLVTLLPTVKIGYTAE